MKTTFNSDKTSKKQLVFIVDDQQLFADIIKESMQNNYVEVKTFASGEECLENMHQNPSIIILDYELDDGSKTKLNGLEVLRKIKASNPETEVVMLSGHERVEIVTNSLKAGAYDYVVKNESTIINLNNRMSKIFKKFELKNEIKELNGLKAKIAVITIAGVILASVTHQFANF